MDVVFVGGFDELGLDLTVKGLQFFLVQQELLGLDFGALQDEN